MYANLQFGRKRNINAVKVLDRAERTGGDNEVVVAKDFGAIRKTPDTLH